MITLNIEKSFSRGRGVDDSAAAITISAAFQSSARIIALFGKSGSGKTTIVNAIAGLVTPDRGVISVDGDTLFHSERGVNQAVHTRGMGYVFQEGLLFPHLNVKQNLLYGANRGGVNNRLPSSIAFEHVVDLLGLTSLLAQRTPTLSGGEKQRVAIGRALLSNPRMVLMDEPLASLDASRRGEILRLIERVRDELRVRIIYVSHSIAEVTRLADDVVVMSEGKSLACDSTESIFNRADLRPFTGRYEGGVLIEAVATAHDARYFLTTFSFDGGELVAPGLEVSVGARVRLRLRARDVAIATARPSGLSIRNVLAGDITAIDDRAGAIVEVHTRVGSRDVLARISRQAADELQLKLGQHVFLLIKAIAFDKRSMGLTR